MKNIDNQSMVLAYLAKNQESNVNPTTAEGICKGTGIFKLNVYKILKGLVEAKQVSILEKSNPPAYVLVNKAIKAKPDATQPQKMQEERIGRISDTATLISKGRDTRWRGFANRA